MAYKSRPYEQNAGTHGSAGSAYNELSQALDSLQAQVERASTGAKPLHGREEIQAIRQRQDFLERNGNRKPVTRRTAATDDLREELAQLRRELSRERAAGSTYRDADRSPNMAADRIAVPPMPQRASSPAAPRSRTPDMSSDIRQLHAEIAQIKADVTRLASEDSVKDLADRWGVIEREMQTLPQTLGSRKDLMNVASRVDDLYEMLSELPRSLPVTAMEAQIRALATAVEQMAMQNSTMSGGQLDAIDMRLDEVTRAIGSLTTSVNQSQFDTAPLDRIEARIATLTRQLEEQASVGSTDTAELDRRFAEIGSRLDSLHSTAERAFSNEAIHSLNTRFDDVASAINDLTRLASADESSERDLAALETMAEQLSNVLDGLNAQKAQQSQTVEAITRSFDARMEELAQRISENEMSAAAVPGIQNLERRMDEIAALMNASQVLTAPEPAPAPDLSHLENQISELSRHLSESVTATAPVPNDDLLDRLAAIESRIGHSDDAIMAAAMQAAEQALARASTGGSPQEAEFVAQMAERLNELDALARSSNQRNEQTFEAIHDTLLKVVDHLSGLESGMGFHAEPPVSNDWDEAPDPSRKVSLTETPPLDYDHRFDDEEQADDDGGYSAPSRPDHPAQEPVYGAAEEEFRDERQIGSRAQGLSPSQAAAAAALAALKNDGDTMDDLDSRQPALSAAPRKADPSFETEDMGSLEDEMLEPGSGGPDLATIIQRVREERGGEGAMRAPVSADAGKNDFIAAARRRAQAAAADTEMMIQPDSENGKRRRAGEGNRLDALKSTLAAKRKPILMGAGAILLALMAVPLVSDMLSGGDSGKTASIGEPAMIDQSDTMTGTDTETDVTADDTSFVIDENTSADVAAVGDEVREIELPSDDGAMETAALETPEEEIVAEVTAPETVSIDTTIPEIVGSVALREAASNGDAKALYVVGEAVIASKGGDSAAIGESSEWFQRAADLGFAPAQYRIGLMKEKGTGVEKDIDGALTYYQLAAQQGNVSAMHNLAVLLASGANGTPDIDSAVEWFHKAAERGVLNSQYNLGVLYGKGSGVEQNAEESYKWFALVAKAGDESAAAPRDEVAGTMAPEALERARGAVELWQPKAVDAAANAVSVPPEWQSGQERTASVEPKQNPADMKKAVQNIQAILNNAGYDAGPIDGMMGGKTRTAILKFQKDNGLVQTGEVDRALVEKLLEVNKKNG